ncbi:hypothetical protein C0989_009322 [Termitomyces sp. Mn162]|nr:hypothetical protein C0989_009322 [Termitomyces sp. Mn162]
MSSSPTPAASPPPPVASSPASAAYSRSSTPVYPLSALRPLVANVSEWARLEHEQRAARNITTFTASPAPGTMTLTCPSDAALLLKPAASPIHANGERILPGTLWKLPQTSEFEIPCCFHGIPARTFRVRSTGPTNGQFVARCSYRAAQCSFYTSFSQHYEQVDGLITRVYAPRTPPSSQRSSDYNVTPEETDEETMEAAIARATQNAQDILDTPVVRRRMRWLRPGTSVMLTAHDSPSTVASPSSGRHLAPSRDRSASPHRLTSTLPPRTHVRSSTSPPVPNDVIDVIAAFHRRSPTGVRTRDFWHAFRKCRGCNRLVERALFEIHCCDLTDL